MVATTFPAEPESGGRRGKYFDGKGAIPADRGRTKGAGFSLLLVTTGGAGELTNGSPDVYVSLGDRLVIKPSRSKTGEEKALPAVSSEVIALYSMLVLMGNSFSQELLADCEFDDVT